MSKAVANPRGNGGGFVEFDTKDSSFIGRSTGGPPFKGRNISHETVQDDWAPGNTNDQLVHKGRGPFVKSGAEAYMGGGQPWVNWTTSAPVPTRLHMRTMTVRTFFYRLRGMAGHTDVARQNAQLLQGKQRMTKARQNKLTVANYRGQSYSATTKMQGE